MVSGHKVIRNLELLNGLSQHQLQALQPVVEKFEFRVSAYYSDLVNWSDPDDPLRRIVLPTPGELASELSLDPSDEADNTLLPGLQHKYGPTALLLVSDVCAAYCRFCFRKRFTLATSLEGHILPLSPVNLKQAERETTLDIEPGLEYIAQHPEINNVLLTGGDPLMLSVKRLEHILSRLKQLPQLKIIRIGTKIPAFDPEKLTAPLLEMLGSYSTPTQRLYLMVHFNHPRELTELALSKLNECLQHGLSVTNQTPLLRGINDNPSVLAELFNRLAIAGVPPYYLFHCRPTQGNESFQLSVQAGLAIVNEAKKQLSGLARRFRYVASHRSGKLEIVGQVDKQLILSYHEAKNPQDEGRLLTWPAAQEIFWFDEVVNSQ